MFHLRYSIAVGVVAMVLPVARAQTAAPAKAAVVQGGTSDGAPSKKVAAKAQLAATAAKPAPAQAQPAPQPNPPENYSDGAQPAKKKIPPWALSQVPADWAVRVLQVPVPDFAGKTLLQVQKEAVASGGRALFAAIYPQEPANGVVVESGQSPKPGTMVIPGTQRLTLKLRIPPPPEPQRTVVPAVKGLGAEEAAVLVKEARLRPNFSGATEGVAGDPSPEAGTPVDFGTAVTVVFAVPPVAVPPLKGLTLDAARQRLAENLLQPGAVNGDNTDGATVASQSPEPLTLVERGSLVEVTMGAGTPPHVPVPDVTKKGCAEARALIVAAGLRPAWKECPRGSVLVNKQMPAAGTMVDPQSMVSALYAPVAVPPLLGLSSQAAVDRLIVAGLEGVVSAPKDWDPAKSIVESQFPQEGVLVDVGSDVSVVMRNLPWWELVPVWGWVVAIGVIGLAGLWRLIRRPPLPPTPPPVMTFQPHGAAGRVRLADEGGPRVRLAIALRDHVGESKTTVVEEPAVTKVEVS